MSDFNDVPVAPPSDGDPVAWGIRTGGHGGSKKCVWVRFVGHKRPLAFKATLAKSLVQIYGEDAGDVDAWPGKRVTLYAQLVDDPQRGKGAMVEAVRIRPTRPTAQQIAEAEQRRAKPGKSAPAKAPDASPARDQAADMRLVDQVGAAIDAARTEAEVEAAIAPHRAAMKGMDERLLNVLASAKKVRLAAIAAAGGGGS